MNTKLGTECYGESTFRAVFSAFRAGANIIHSSKDEIFVPLCNLIINQGRYHF